MKIHRVQCEARREQEMWRFARESRSGDLIFRDVESVEQHVEVARREGGRRKEIACNSGDGFAQNSSGRYDRQRVEPGSASNAPLVVERSVPECPMVRGIKVLTDLGMRGRKVW